MQKSFSCSFLFSGLEYQEGTFFFKLGEKVFMGPVIVVIMCYIKKTQFTEVNLSAFAYRLFHEDFSSILQAKSVALNPYGRAWGK